MEPDTQGNRNAAEPAGGSSAPGALPIMTLPATVAAQYLPKFVGAESDLSDWAERLKGLIRSHVVPAVQQPEVALCALEGEARRAVLHLPPEERDSVEKILAYLGRIFSDHESLHELQRKFMNRRQGEEEPLLQFANALQDIMAAAKRKGTPGRPMWQEPNVWLKEQFLQGLRSWRMKEKLREKLASNNSMPFSELLGLATALQGEEDAVTSPKPWMEARKRAEVRTTCGIADPVSAEPLGEVVRKMAASMNQLQEQVSLLQLECQKNWSKAPPARREKDRRSQKCWNCNQEGHYSRNCTKNKQNRNPLN